MEAYDPNAWDSTYDDAVTDGARIYRDTLAWILSGEGFDTEHAFKKDVLRYFGVALTDDEALAVVVMACAFADRLGGHVFFTRPMVEDHVLFRIIVRGFDDPDETFLRGALEGFPLDAGTVFARHDPETMGLWAVECMRLELRAAFEARENV